MRKKIAFIGVGNMATAILTGITSKDHDVTPWSDIVLYNRHQEKILKYEKFGARIVHSVKEAVESADFIFLCVKPQNFPEILPALSECTDVASKIFVTIAAGITTQAISDAAGGAAVIRAMPNTPMLIGKGVIAICCNSLVSSKDFDFVSKIFASSGKVVVIDEEDMNRIICVTGSSPAYVFLLIKAMYDGAAMQGLLGDESGKLSSKELIDSICDTIIGAAELMKSDIKSPDEQISAVASKGGTTERALAELERFKFCDGIESAMQKCTERADELGSKKE